MVDVETVLAEHVLLFHASAMSRRGPVGDVHIGLHCKLTAWTSADLRQVRDSLRSKHRQGSLEHRCSAAIRTAHCVVDNVAQGLVGLIIFGNLTF